MLPTNKSKDIALLMLRTLPRVALNNIRDNPNSKKKDKRGRAQHGGDTHGCGTKGSKARQNFMRIGYETGNNPFYKRPPNEPYYKGHHLRRQYPPISLLKLQKMIDTSRLDISKPIDLVALIRTGLFDLRPDERHFGFQLTDEGANIFNAKINIEVQAASELVISTIERCGGNIITAFYDMHSLQAMINPERFFKKGIPIPRRMVPPESAIPFYADPKQRGFLAKPEDIEYEKLVLSQKYGYVLPKRDEADFELMNARKDPLQIFYGLQPGWVVNLAKKAIYKPLEQSINDYFSNRSNFD